MSSSDCLITSLGVHPPVTSVPVMASLLVTLSTVFELELAHVESKNYSFRLFDFLIKYVTFCYQFLISFS